MGGIGSGWHGDSAGHAKYGAIGGHTNLGKPSKMKGRKLMTKSFFDLPEKEKKDMISKAAQDSNAAQRKLVEDAKPGWFGTPKKHHETIPVEDWVYCEKHPTQRFNRAKFRLCFRCYRMSKMADDFKRADEFVKKEQDGK